jgi:hypothetical protein
MSKFLLRKVKVIPWKSIVRCFPGNEYYLLHHIVLYLYYMHSRQMKVAVNLTQTPYETFNVLLSRTETTVKRKVMSESYVENTYSGEDEESDALRYKDHPSNYLDFDKGFVSSSSRPSSDGSACSSDIVQCDEVNSVRAIHCPFGIYRIIVPFQGFR